MADRRPTARLKRLIAERAAGCCEYCRSQERYATPAFSVEHIVPRQRGGRTALAWVSWTAVIGEKVGGAGRWRA
jgi:5-methylcytosine-specific restriction endonuclease McrA